MVFNFRKNRALLAMLVPVLVGFGPCGPIAGTGLSGVEVAGIVADFRFVSGVDNCVLEVNSADPHSVTVNCWSVGQQLFIGCMDCEGKTWSTLVKQDSTARVQVGEKLYPVNAKRIDDEFVVNRAWTHRWQKYEEGEVTPVPEGFWLYHLGSQPRG